MMYKMMQQMQFMMTRYTQQDINTLNPDTRALNPKSFLTIPAEPMPIANSRLPLQGLESLESDRAGDVYQSHFAQPMPINST